MGAQLFTITLGSLLIIWLIDFFVEWYAKFLKRWLPSAKMQALLMSLVWVFLALIFWNSLYHKHFPETFSLTYSLFVLFIYSVRGLIDSFVRRLRNQRSHVSESE